MNVTICSKFWANHLRPNSRRLLLNVPLKHFYLTYTKIFFKVYLRCIKCLQHTGRILRHILHISILKSIKHVINKEMIAKNRKKFKKSSINSCNSLNTCNFCIICPIYFWRPVCKNSALGFFWEYLRWILVFFLKK